MKINVAITMEIRADVQQSIWFNGANQHCVYLYMLLKRSPLVGEVWLVHGDGVAAYAEGMMLGELAGALRPLSAVVHQTDLLIEMNAFVHPTHVEAVRQRGGHCVSYRFGNDYVVAVETINFQANPWLPNPHRVQFDELWTNPQHAHTCKSYFEAVYRAPVHVLPHVWSPYFLDRSLAANPELKARFGYRNQGRAKRIAFFEPNLNVVKSSLIPMLAANECHVRRPELVQHVYMTNTFDKKENTAFKHIALGLRMVQDGKATADPRGPFVEWAAHHTDIVVSHQWENGLNYLLYEALYGNYALVHNSPFLREVGYYYPEFEVFEAAAAIERAAETHDAQLDAQAQANAAFLRTLAPAHAPNIEAHDARIRALFAN
ncbi:DUF2827 family protein [Variovorax paradoxus]|uniref:DUF2827 family protein n=1 Tax=Variovorax paradoxus TaxID=34073 RepID=UPI001933D780|nr:DUF2827 domain-containing protein [Variovorax paradoxus]